jgi:hypothetical protein
VTLTDLASIGTLISSVAVLISLIYVGLQVKITEKNQRALINQGVLTRTVDMVKWNTEPHIGVLVTRVFSGETDFTAEEINRLRLIMRVRLSNFQDAHLQRHLHVTDEITYENAFIGIQILMAQPVFRSMWKRHRDSYASELVEVVDRVISDTPLSRPADSVAQFKSDLAAVQAPPPPVRV